jgi:hypothetical protein
MNIKTFEVVLRLALLLGLLMPGTAGATSYTLTVSSQGSGTVTKNPTNSLYPAGVTVIVTATPDAGSYFANWSGDATGTNNPLNVTMNSNLVITGNFLPFPTYTLMLTTNGQGTIALNPAGGGSYLSNSVVTATATPSAGWVFTSWSGSTNSNTNPLSLTMNTNNSLTGNFVQLPAFDLQPLGVTNVVGSTVTFSAHAAGTAPLGYQWFFSSGSLTNATNATLSLTNVSSGQAGNYFVVATNNYGSATSSVVLLALTNAVGPTNVVNSPDEASLRAAIKIGGWIGLAFNGTITITNTINLTNNVILDASGVSATISGGNAVRLFYVAPGVTFAATNLTLANGSCIVTNGTAGTPADAGAIYNDGGIVTLFSCTLTNNSAQSLIFGGLARGGAIFNNGGTVSLFQSGVSNNAAIGGGPFNNSTIFITGIALGGAIFTTNGSLTIISCNVSSNFCYGVCEPSLGGGGTGLTMGGAVFQASGSLTVANSIFSSNLALGGNGAGSPSAGPASPAYGGALAANGGSITVDHCQFFANTAIGGNIGNHGVAGPAYGGAVYSTAALTVTDSSLFGNQALAGNGNSSLDEYGYGGAIYNLGTAALNRCLVYSNYTQGGYAQINNDLSQNGGNGLGGGIFNASQLTATNCTITLNSAVSGSGSPVGLFNSPPAGLNGNAMGGGVFNNTSATFIAMNLTIASNFCVANGVVGFSGTNGFVAGTQIANTNGTLRLHNSIVAYGGTNGNSYGTITDDGYNISSDSSAQLFGGSSYNYTDPKLGPLANYGGPTFCMALLSNSPAIDFGDSSGIPNTDQRGYVRPLGAGPDIGAFEYGSYFPNLVYLNITSTANSVVLSFPASATNSYRLQASTNLSAWTDLNTNGPFGVSTNISQTISEQGLNLRFFRLLVQ